MDQLPAPTTSQVPLLSVIVPAYNEHEVLPEFHRRLASVLAPLGMPSEIIYVNDGSTDNTLEVIRGLRDTWPGVTVVDLSRNFGKEAAMTAGFDLARGDAVVVIDADLQDPPELIPAMVEKWKAGFDMVYAQRTVRDGESGIKKTTSYLFYRLIQRVSRVKIPKDTGDYRLLSRRAVLALNTLREQHRFMKGLFAFIGFPQTAIPYRRDPRFAGKTKFNYWKLWNFAIEGFTSFTIAPLKLATYLGIFTSLVSFFYGMYVVYKTLLHGDHVAGYPSMMVVITFLGGAQLAFIGVLGEYIGRMFNETKRRPLYFLNAYEPSHCPAADEQMSGSAGIAHPVPERRWPMAESGTQSLCAPS
ncbi:glycosyltransferase family 2 protein [Telluria sp. B2]